MKISLKWLQDYVAAPPAEEVARRLTMAGLEIEGLEQPGKALAGVRVAQIRESAKHPNADKLSVTRVDVGGELLQVVCGAKNYQVGDKVPLATVGTVLPNGTKIEKAKLRGVESFGMLCSARELGLAEEASGLLILDPAAEVGAPIAEALGLDDAVLEVNVTPNRPDALSHLGIAREVSVLTGAPLRVPEPKLVESSGPSSDAIRIRIDEPERCPRYAARVVEGVTVGPSPEWLVRRLKACGVRSINNVVDVTNYVLLEYGQPLHAFDLDRLAGAEIIVRQAKPGERMTTLDGKERVLDPDDLLICDRDRPQVLAGVMGGADSEVGPSSRRILLECAHFQPASIRRSSKRHALHSESSHRFERGTDVGSIPAVLDRAAALIAELAGGSVRRGRVDAYPRPVEPRMVELRYARVGEVLGVEVPEEESRRILTQLGFAAEGASPGVERFSVPLARVDVQGEEDLIEEIARIRGFDSIPSRMPRGMARLHPEPDAWDVERRVRQALAGCGFDEVLNFSFVNPKDLAALGDPIPPIAIVNPLSADQSVMRTSLYPGLLLNVARNLRHQVEDLRLYEVGRVYLPSAEGGQQRRPAANEVTFASGALYGRRQGRTWTDKDGEVDFYDAKGAVESVLSALGIQGARFEPLTAPQYHPRAAARVLWNELELGALGELHPKVARAYDVPERLFLFQLALGELERAAQLRPLYRPVTRFPAVLRDLAVVVPLELANEALKRLVLEVGAPLVEDATVFDVYTGKPIPTGKKNVAYALRYRAADRTLTDAEVNEAHQRIVAEVNARLGGSLRGSNPE